MMLIVPAYLAAWQDQESVADAARRAQAEKKNAPKAKMTIDNDNLGTLTGVVNVVGHLLAGEIRRREQETHGRPARTGYFAARIQPEAGPVLH
jgi:hypothetical protein